jgi:hypothetical protein
MSDGEKKRFGNFAEYAQARKEQQGMPGMSGPGIGNNNDQSRFMQSFGSSSGSGQQPGPNGNMMGGMMQQQQQDLQQRGMAPGSGLGGGGGLGMQQNPMNRSGLGMGLGNMQGGGGRGGGAQGGAGGGGGGMGGRVGMQGGGAGGMGSIGGVARPGNIGGGGMGGGGGGGVQQGYGDGGDLLALLNKGGMGGAALNDVVGDAIQISTEDRTYVFHVAQMRSGNQRNHVPKKLKELLENRKILKSGVNIMNDNKHLAKLGVTIPVESMEDIASIAKKLGICDKAPSLKTLAALLLRVDMDKSLARSYWDGMPTSALPQPLVDYAGLR